MASIRIIDLPDLGAISDIASFVGDLAGSGRFAALALKNYILGGTVIPFATIAALRANTSSLWTVAQVQGYASYGDGGGGIFYRIDSDTTSTDNGGTIFVDANGKRWHRRWDSQVLELTWFGGTTVSDYAPLLTAALAVATTLAASRPGVTIQLPGRTMAFASAVTFTYPNSSRVFSLTLAGTGLDASVLNFTSTNGLTLNMSQDGHTIHLRDLTLACGSSNLRTGLIINQSMSLGIWSTSDFVRVGFRGIDATAGAACWAICAVITGLSNYNFVDCNFIGAVLAGSNTGTGVIAQGTNSPQVISVIQNFTGCDWIFFAECVTYGDAIQGMTLDQCNMTTCDYGVRQHAGSGVSVIGAQLGVNNCQFGTSKAGLMLEGALANVYVNGSLFYGGTANAKGIYAPAGSTITRYSIVGNGFEGNNSSGSAGVVMNGTDSQAVVSGNTFYGWVSGISSTGTINGGCMHGNSIVGIGTSGNSGIILQGTNSYIAISGNFLNSLQFAVSLGTGANHCNVQSNVYSGVTNTVTNAGTANTVGGASS